MSELALLPPADCVCVPGQRLEAATRGSANVMDAVETAATRKTPVSLQSRRACACYRVDLFLFCSQKRISDTGGAV